MVRIRYAELPAGLHVATEAGDRCTIVYLKPGLTKAQRKDALTVARRTARFGHGPSLPALDMAFALAADRTRTAARIFTSAMRKHPLLLLPVVALVAGIVAAGVLASAAIVVTPPPHVNSAQTGDVSQLNIGRLVIPGSKFSPGPSDGAARSGTPAPGGGAPAQPTSDGSGTRHGRGRSGSQPAAGIAQSASARQSRGMSSGSD